jgi:hypothetical protein
VFDYSLELIYGAGFEKKLLVQSDETYSLSDKVTSGTKE